VQSWQFEQRPQIVVTADQLSILTSMQN